MAVMNRRSGSSGDAQFRPVVGLGGVNRKKIEAATKRAAEAEQADTAKSRSKSKAKARSKSGLSRSAIVLPAGAVGALGASWVTGVSPLGMLDKLEIEAGGRLGGGQRALAEAGLENDDPTSNEMALSTVPAQPKSAVQAVAKVAAIPDPATAPARAATVAQTVVPRVINQVPGAGTPTAGPTVANVAAPVAVAAPAASVGATTTVETVAPRVINQTAASEPGVPVAVKPAPVAAPVIVKVEPAASPVAQPVASAPAVEQTMVVVEAPPEQVVQPSPRRPAMSNVSEVICFAGCGGQVQRVVYYGPIVALQTRKSDVAQVAFAPAAPVRAVAAVNDAGSRCFAGCYAADVGTAVQARRDVWVMNDRPHSSVIEPRAPSMIMRVR